MYRRFLQHTWMHASHTIYSILQHTWRAGAQYPVGGPSRIASGILRVIEKCGGKVLVRAPVAHIIVDSKGRACGVKLDTASGDEIYASTVVRAVGAQTTFNKLVPEEHKWRVKRQIDGVNDARVQAEVSLASLYVGLEGGAELKLPASNVWLFPTGYDHDAGLERYPQKLSKILSTI
jgi:all-trans-retinol 13,14-reductase